MNPWLYLVFMVFATVYFGIWRNYKRLQILVLSHYLLVAIGIIFWIFTRMKLSIYYYILGNYILLAYTFFVLGVLIVAGFRYNKTKASFFLLAVAVLFVSGIVFALCDAGIIRMEWLPTNPLLLGSVIEFAIFSVALIFEVRTINETKNALLLERTGQQRKLLKAYVEGAEKERLRLSQELHDNVGSRLALLKHRISQFSPDDSKLIGDVGDLYKEVQSMSHELSPGDFHVIRFEEFIQIYLQKYKQTTHIDVKLIVEDLPRLNAATSGQLFRVLQEAAQNVQKHSQAKIFEVQLINHEDELVMTLDDDGIGFDASTQKDTDMRGISNMKTRIESLGGTLEISSEPNAGTHILISLPLIKDR